MILLTVNNVGYLILPVFQVIYLTLVYLELEFSCSQQPTALVHNELSNDEF